METTRTVAGRKQGGAGLVAALPDPKTPVQQACTDALKAFRAGTMTFAELERFCLAIAPETGNLGAAKEDFERARALIRTELSKKEPNLLICEEAGRRAEHAFAEMRTIEYWTAREVALGLRPAGV